jgi:5-methylcytosine-specific restriction protein A
MPPAPLRPCAAQPCKHLVPKGRCPEHALEYEQQRRPDWITRFYSSRAWQNVRNMKRRHDPLCEECLITGMFTPVQTVDHILPLTTHPTLKLHLTNLRSLCFKHHEAKTKRGRR